MKSAFCVPVLVFMADSRARSWLMVSETGSSLFLFFASLALGCYECTKVITWPRKFGCLRSFLTEDGAWALEWTEIDFLDNCLALMLKQDP